MQVLKFFISLLACGLSVHAMALSESLSKKSPETTQQRQHRRSQFRLQRQQDQAQRKQRQQKLLEHRVQYHQDRALAEAEPDQRTLKRQMLTKAFKDQRQESEQARQNKRESLKLKHASKTASP